jgi:hypothetical protein
LWGVNLPVIRVNRAGGLSATAFGPARLPRRLLQGRRGVGAIVQGHLDAPWVDAHLIHQLVQQLPPLAGGEVAVQLIEVAQNLMDGRQRQRPPLVRPELGLLLGDARLEGTAAGL